jgi:hypothetical protein
VITDTMIKECALEMARLLAFCDARCCCTGMVEIITPGACDPMLEVSTRCRRFPVSALAISIRRTPSSPLATEARGTRTRASGPSGPFQAEEGPFIHCFHV